MKYNRFRQFHFVGLAVGVGLGLVVSACTQSVETDASDVSISTDPSSDSGEVASPIVDNQISVSGVGPIEIGMTVAEAETVAQIALVSKGQSSPGRDCSYVYAADGFQSLDFMLNADKIVRLDLNDFVWRPQPDGEASMSINVGDSSQLATAEGISLSSSEADVRAAYPDIEERPHKYVDAGSYLTLAAPDGTTKLIFETDGKDVTAIRVGQPPEVDYVEGCS